MAKENLNRIEIDCSKLNSNATIKLGSKILEIIEKDYENIVEIRIKATND